MDMKGTGKAAKAFHDEFTSNLPAGAETGLYSAAAHDAFHGRLFSGLHGNVRHGEWTFRFDKGRFVHATHAHRKRVAAPVDAGKTDVA